MKYKYIPRTKSGRRICVGDIHGSFGLLKQGLERIKFDPGVDELFCTGDLVDKGPASKEVVSWLPFINSVRGNHDEHVVRHGTSDQGKWIDGHGQWFARLHKQHQQQIKAALELLPIAIAVETDLGIVTIVHAEVPCDTWARALAILHKSDARTSVQPFLFSRTLFDSNHHIPIKDIRAVIHGHQPVKTPEVRANRYYIDTEAYKTGVFTFLDIDTLEVI